MTKEVLESWLIERLAEEIGVAPEMIDADAPTYIYFLNGFQSSGVVSDLEEKLRRNLSPSVLYEKPTIAALAAQLSEPEKEKRQSRKLPFTSLVRKYF